MNGDTVAVVASQFILRSSRATSSLIPSCKRAFEREFIGHRASGFYLPVDLAVAEIEDGDQRRDAELLARDGDRVHAVGLAEGAQKLRVRAARVAEPGPFGEDDGPRKHREDEKDREHGPGHRSGVHDRVCNADLQKKKGCRQEGNAPPVLF